MQEKQENPCDEVVLPEKNECIKMTFQIEPKKFPETDGYFFAPYIPCYRIDFHFLDHKIIPYNHDPKHHKEGL